MIAAYSPEARGRSERAFATHQGRLPKDWRWPALPDMDAANRYLRDVYRPAFNGEFAQPPLEDGSAFVPFLGEAWTTFCVSNSNAPWAKTIAVRFEGPYAANSQRSAPVPLRQGQSPCTPLPGRYTGGFSWPPAVGRI